MQVTLNGRDYDYGGVRFHYYSVFRAFPALGPSTGGTVIHLNGTELQRNYSSRTCRFGDVHYDMIGKAFGCHVERVTEPNEVGPALDRAIAAKETAVIDIVTDPDAGKLRKEDPSVQTIAFSDLVASRNSQYKAEVI